MNFLSHFYIHRGIDNFFNVGLTAPDLLGFHSIKVRVTEKYLRSVALSYEEPMRSCIAGMIMHIRIDKYFHNSRFFKEKMVYLDQLYKTYSSNDNLPNHISHILLEILVDKYLLKIEPNLANDFYQNYLAFDFHHLLGLFSGLNHFDSERFITLTKNIAESNFLNDYKDDFAVIDILKRVSRRIGLSFTPLATEEELVSFFKQAGRELEPEIIELFRDINALGWSKEEILNELSEKPIERIE